MKRLNLGCREEFKEGFINLDYDEKLNPDVLWNLNNFPYPFENNEFDYIYASHVIEHLNNRFEVLKELIRITKNGGIIHIRVPHFSCGFSHTEQTHVFPLFGWYSFKDYIDGQLPVKLNYKIVKQRYNFLSWRHPIANKLLSLPFNLMPKTFYERFLCWILPVNEIEVKLQVEK